jgi:hypothetical protein
MVTKAMLVIVVIPSLLAFAFGAWVYYNMVLDVARRPLAQNKESGSIIDQCIYGCQNTDVLNTP